MIIYFSGTGNSEYCARQLGRLLQDEVVNSADFIRKKKPGRFRSKKPWIFCAPVYVAYIPLVFHELIRKSVFDGSRQFYFVITLGGNERGGSIAPAMLKSLCRKLGKQYMGAGHISMPRNDVVHFRLQDEAVITERLMETKKILPEYARRISSGERLPEYRINKFEYVMVRPFIGFFYKLLMRDKKFCADEKCIGCGLCQKVCPMGNIEMEKGKPGWKGNCTMCEACINRCPVQAIQYGRSTQKRGRYYAEKYIRREKCKS